MPVPFHGEPFEIGFNPEFLRDGLESVESGDLVLKLISPLRPGLIESADDGGFLYLIMPIRLERVGGGACGSCASRCATSAATRAPTSRSGPGADGRPRAATAPARRTCSRRSTSAAPGARAARRNERELVRFGEQRRARRGRRREAPDGAHELSVGFDARRAEADDGRRRARRAAARRRRPAARERLPARPARAGQGRAGAAPRAPRPGRRRAVAGARGDAPRLRAGARAAQRAARAHPRRRARRAASLPRVGRASWRGTGIALLADRAARGRRCSPSASPRAPRSSGSTATPTLALPAALDAPPTPRSSPPSSPSAATRDLERGFTGHGPHRDDLALHARRARAARLRLAGRAAPGAARAAAGRARGARRRRAARTPLMLLDDVMSELDARPPRRGSSSCCARRRPERRSRRPTSTHVPGRRRAATSTRLAVADGAVLAGGGAPRERAARPRPLARGARRRSQRALAPATLLAEVQRVWPAAAGAAIAARGDARSAERGGVVTIACAAVGVGPGARPDGARC